MALRHWIEAARLRTLPLALSCIILGSLLALGDGYKSLAVTAMAVLTTIFLQVLSNFANDYGDTQHGADNSIRKGPKRMVQQGFITQKQMLAAIILFSLLSFVSGSALLWVAFGKDNLLIIGLFLVLGLASIAAAIKYTAGKSPYGYAGFGDLFVLVFFGYVGVLGMYFLLTGSFYLSILLPATACGALAVGVLNLNNMRDIVSDQASGKKSIPVRIGIEKAKAYQSFLIWLAISCGGLYTWFESYYFKNYWLYFIGIVPLIFIAQKLSRISDPQNFDPFLKKLALATLWYCIFLGLSHLRLIDL